MEYKHIKFGRELKKGLAHCGVKNYEAAEFLGVSPAFLSAVATGKKSLSFGKVEKLAHFFRSRGYEQSEQFLDVYLESTPVINMEHFNAPKLRERAIIARILMGAYDCTTLSEIERILKTKH